MCTKQPHMHVQTKHEGQINMFFAKFCERISVWLVLHEDKLTDVMTFICISVCLEYLARLSSQAGSLII